jgi:hypothetical protein
MDPDSDGRNCDLQQRYNDREMKMGQGLGGEGGRDGVPRARCWVP